MQRLLRQVVGSQFLRHNAIYFAGSITVGALNYMYYPVLGRMLGAAAYGEVQTLTSLFLQVSIFFTILTYVTVHVTVNSTDVVERNQTLLGLEKVALMLGAVFSAIALLLSPWLRSFLNFGSIWPFVALIVAIPLNIPVAFRIAFLRGRKQFARASITDGASSAGKLILSPLLVLVFVNLKSFGAILGLAITQLLSLAVGVVWARQAGLTPQKALVTKQQLQKLMPHLRYGVAILLVSISVMLFQTGSVFAVKHYFAPEDAGQYAGMLTIATIIYFLTAPFTGVLMSSVKMQNSAHKNRMRLFGTLGLIMALGGGTTLVMALLPGLVTRILLGHSYLMFVHYLWRLSVTMLVMALANALLMYNISLKRYDYCVTAVVGMCLLIGMVLAFHNTILALINAVLATALLFLVVVIAQTITKGGLRQGVAA